ncbi:MAG: hypothetical protein H7A35_11730 [Planctomycetales bacterium]|nr:hypothetical protein [bacterium]UNM07528.1 MAG: hypothetical protein H7A35_11730 [Planctomycetales bacterium]
MLLALLQNNILYEGAGVLFWLVIYGLTVSVVLIWTLVRFGRNIRTGRHLTWDMHTSYIDISEFSNRNIPLKVSYKGHEPAHMWATYLVIKNTGKLDISSSDAPEKRQLVVGAEGCRYIGFNKLISEKAKVVLNPQFRENDVWCTIEFDRLGPGDEILCSLLFIAEEQKRVEMDGALFGEYSEIHSGYRERISSWRMLWWLLIWIIIIGVIGGWVMIARSVAGIQPSEYNLLLLLFLYVVALSAASLLLRPIRFWQQIPQKFSETKVERKGRTRRSIAYLFGMIDEI